MLYRGICRRHNDAFFRVGNLRIQAFSLLRKVVDLFVSTRSGPYSAILQFQTDKATCPSYRDPRLTVMASLNTLMFGVGGAAALSYGAEDLEALMDAGLSVRKTVVGNVEGDHTVFHSSYAFFVAAVVVQAATIAMVVPTYWGWWRLGRSMSFSPLELAKVGS